ncbi:MAG: DUF4404 family protein [Chloroflexi bacterium]|nr:DUF4404 family protein [Chloroflexota bacterium]
MDKEQLNALLKQLHAELSEADTVDAENRETLRALAKDIAELLDRADDDGASGYQALLEPLKLALVQFEVLHPMITLAITRVINALADMGV